MTPPPPENSRLSCGQVLTTLLFSSPTCFFRQKLFWTQIVLTKFFFYLKFFSTKICFDPNFCQTKKIFCSHIFLAAMISSRSEDFTQFVQPLVCMLCFFNLEAFIANFDVLMVLVFHKGFSSILPVFHLSRGKLPQEPFQVRFKWDEKQSCSSQMVVTKLIIIIYSFIVTIQQHVLRTYRSIGLKNGQPSIDINAHIVRGNSQK